MHSNRNETNIMNSSIQKITNRKITKASIYVVIGSILYAMAVVWVFELGNFFAGGAAGVGQLIVKFIKDVFNIELPLSIMIFLVNLPLFLIGFRRVSKKFVILTLISVIVQSVSVEILETCNFNPFNIPEFASNRFFLAVFGGGLAGLGASLCLKYGGSSGGADIISNMMLVKKDGNFTKIIFIVDFTIIALSGLEFKNGFSYEFDTAIFTLVRLVAYSYAIDTFYTSYRPIKLQIITTEADKMRELMLEKIQHGITMYKAVGAYTLKEKTVLEIYASAYEVNDYIAIAKYVDPNSFIAACAVKTIKGNYIKKTIV